MMNKKEKTLTTNRGFIVDTIFNFPQGVSYDREAYVNKIISVMNSAYIQGRFDTLKMTDDFETFLSQPCKFQDDGETTI